MKGRGVGEEGRDGVRGWVRRGVRGRGGSEGWKEHT